MAAVDDSDPLLQPIHGVNLANDLWNQALNRVNVDLKFVCAENVEIHAHKAIFAVHHDAWKNVLSDAPSEDIVTVLAPEFDPPEALAEIQSLYYNNVSQADAHRFPILNSVGPPCPAPFVAKDKQVKARPKSRDFVGRLRRIAQKMPWLVKRKEVEEGNVEDIIDKVDRAVEEIIYDDGGRRVGTLTVRPKEVKKCEVCGKTFRASEMKEHLKTHFMDKFKNPCKQCDLVFPSMASLESHRARVHDERFKCKKCPESPSLGTPQKLEEHVKEFHYEAAFRCSLCDNVSYSAESYHNHAKGHIKWDPVTKVGCCPFCFKNFGSKKSLTHLMIHLDPTSYKFSCEYCNLKFYNLHKRIEHENVAHTGALTYVCEKCTRGFATSARRAVHKKRCNGDPTAPLKLKKKGVTKKAAKKVKKTPKKPIKRKAVEYQAEPQIQHHVVYQTHYTTHGTIQFADFYG